MAEVLRQYLACAHPRFRDTVRHIHGRGRNRDILPRAAASHSEVTERSSSKKFQGGFDGDTCSGKSMVETVKQGRADMDRARARVDDYFILIHSPISRDRFAERAGGEPPRQRGRL